MKILSIESQSGLRLYPSAQGNGVIISQEEMRKISSHFHNIYSPIIQNICKNILVHTNIKSENLEIIIRYSTIPIIFAFFDKLIRFNKFIEENGKDFHVEELDCYNFLTPPTISEFRKNAEESYKFNSYMLHYVSRLWDIQTSKVKSPSEKYKTEHKKTVNNLSRIYSRSFINGIKFRISLFLSKMRKGKAPVFGFANSKAPLLKYGFYNKLFDDFDLNWPKKKCNVNDALRSRIFTADIFDCPEVNEFYESQKFTVNKAKINNEICNFIKLFFPLDSLELFEFNIDYARSSLKKYNSSYIVARGGSTNGKFIITAAKEKNMKIVGTQHGGYYGYINDNHQAIEFEYRDLDIFISWGWSRLPGYEFLKNVQVIKMPSPWLSERKKYWKTERIENNKKYDVLFMPSGITRFPLTVRGALGPRIDIISDLSSDIKDTFGALIEHNISILFKPYSHSSLKLLNETIYNLKYNYGDKYNTVDAVEKGFTKELISSCGLVLWNQPGTGFLECITANIPTIVYWTRFSTLEEKWAEEIFKKLEKIGIIHTSVDSLVKEIKVFNKSPDDWINNPERIDVIKEFCDQYARVDDHWYKQWRIFFSNLS
jgi:putative transferase (TIGR04331 family)